MQTLPAAEEPNDDRKALTAADGLNMNSITGNIVMVATKDYDEPHREAVRWLHAFAREQGWSLGRLAAELDVTTGTLSRVFTGKYGAKLDSIAEKIRVYRKAYGVNSNGKEIFVETSISRKIWKACEYAMASKQMVFVFGNRGIGKTTTFNRFRACHNHGLTKLMRMPASAGVQLMMKEMAKMCFISPNSCFENLRESVFAGVDESNLVIVDEAHQPFLSYQKGSAVKCLEVLREFKDRTGCGLLLGGTSQLSKGILGVHKEVLEQFTDRGVLQVQLPDTIPHSDIHLIAKAHGITDAPTGAAAEIVEDIIRARSLRRFGALLQAAKNSAAKDDAKISWAHFVKAHDILAKLGGQK